MGEGKSLTGTVAEPLILELFDGRTDVATKVIREEVTELHLSRGGLPETSPTAFPITTGLERLKKQGKANNPKRGFWNIDSTGIEADIAGKDKLKKGVLTVGEGSSTVYLYYFLTYRSYAESKKEKYYPCKIGRTNAKDPVAYIINQVGTTLPEKPIPGFLMKTNDPVGLEKRIHRALDNVDLRMKDAPGEEWFFTNTEQVKEFYELVK